jgi:Putative beta barrel porin-7 (BBP7)
MLFARLKLCLVTAVALAAIAGVRSAPAQEWTPFGPSEVRYDLELFKRPDVSAYADWPRPNYGFFFQYERLYWAIQQPSRTDIGVPNSSAIGLVNGVVQFDPTNQPVGNILTSYSNSLDTGFLRADQTWGNREKGWLLGIMNLQDQIQNAFFGGDSNNGTIPGGIKIVFRDPRHLLLGFVDTNGDGFDDDLNANPFTAPGIFNKVPGIFGRGNERPPQPPSTPLNLDTNGDGIPDSYAGFSDFGDMVPLVPLFNQITIRNVTSMNSVEIMRTWRYPPNHRGNQWQLMFGLRWLLYRDGFFVTALNDIQTPEGTTGDLAPGLPGVSFWNSTIDNNMFGPQIGLRWDHTAGRWDLSSELRFLAACNFQSVHLNGELASGLDPIPGQPGTGGTVNPVNVPFQLVRMSFNTWRLDETFAPVGEVRATVSYKLTQAIAVQAGYNAMIGGGIGRASRRIDYVLPMLQILDANKNDAWFVNGVNIGITVNR